MASNNSDPTQPRRSSKLPNLIIEIADPTFINLADLSVVAPAFVELVRAPAKNTWRAVSP